MVDAGEDGVVYTSNTLHIALGDKVEFHFYPGNHSVAQAAFDNPCHLLSDTSLFSGFVSPSSDESVRQL